jgi:hypothetical protein
MSYQPADLLDFVIEKSLSRERRYATPAPTDCEESIEIFDELDSLPADELAIIFALYLVGTGEEDDRESALQRARCAGFDPLDAMAFDQKLHLVLSAGRQMWLQLK